MQARHENMEDVWTGLGVRSGSAGIVVGNYARHVRCLLGRGWVGLIVWPRVMVCDLCARVVSAANYTRHHDGCRVAMTGASGLGLD